MTVAGQKNHYNVKLLKGYGVSISLKDNRICLKGGRDPFTGEKESEEWFVTQIPYERIVISGKGYLSTEAVKLLTDHNINIILTDTYGNLITAMHKVMSSPTATNYRIAQYDTFRNPEKVAYLQKQFLKMKLESQIQFFQSIHRPEVQEAIDGLATHIMKIDGARDKRLVVARAFAGHPLICFNPEYGIMKTAQTRCRP
jgi:CRISPR-associated protein Cas1